MSAILKGLQTVYKGSISLLEASLNVFTGTFSLASTGLGYGVKAVGLIKKITGGKTQTSYLREFHRHHRRKLRK